MKVTLRSLYATPERVVQAGATADLPAKEARALIDSGHAVRAADDPAARLAPAQAEEPDSDDQDENELPSRKARKRTWVAYAVEHGGMTETDAKQLTRDELAERFLSTEEPDADDQDTTEAEDTTDAEEGDESADDAEWTEEV